MMRDFVLGRQTRERQIADWNGKEALEAMHCVDQVDFRMRGSRRWKLVFLSRQAYSIATSVFRVVQSAVSCHK